MIIKAKKTKKKTENEQFLEGAGRERAIKGKRVTVNYSQGRSSRRDRKEEGTPPLPSFLTRSSPLSLMFPRLPRRLFPGLRHTTFGIICALVFLIFLVRKVGKHDCECSSYK